MRHKYLPNIGNKRHKYLPYISDKRHKYFPYIDDNRHKYLPYIGDKRHKYLPLTYDDNGDDRASNASTDSSCVGQTSVHSITGTGTQTGTVSGGVVLDAGWLIVGVHLGLLVLSIAELMPAPVASGLGDCCEGNKH